MGFRWIWAKRAIRFLSVFALVYGLLMALWAVWGASYCRLYRTGATPLLESFHGRAIVRFQPADNPRDEVRIAFYDRDSADSLGRLVPRQRIVHDVRCGDYIYTAFLVALVVATPISWSRRGRALLWGLLLIHLFMILRLAILIGYLLNTEPVALLALNWFWSRLLLMGTQVLTVNILPAFVVCILIWTLVALRREDWLALMGPPAHACIPRPGNAGPETALRAGPSLPGIAASDSVVGPKR
jgi:hypothetical protein